MNRSARWTLALALTGLFTAGPAVAQQERADSLAMASARAAAARVQPGDRIVLRVWREKNLSDTVMVDQNGNAVLPQLGLFPASAQTIGSLPDTLRSRYGEYLRNPSIDVAVLRRIGVLGEVKKPDLYWVDVTMTLPDMIARAGGVTEIGNPGDVRVMRGSATIKIRDWERGGTLASDLLSGDQIVVGRTSWLSRNMLSVVSAVGVMASIVFTLFRL